MKFYYNENLKWWAVSYEKDLTYVYVFLKGENPSNTLLETREVEALLGDKWEERNFTPTKKEWADAFKETGTHVFKDWTLEDDEEQENKEPHREFSSTEDAELLAEMENKKEDYYEPIISETQKVLAEVENRLDTEKEKNRVLV